MSNLRIVWLVALWPLQDIWDRIADTWMLICYGRRLNPEAFLGWFLLAVFFWGSLAVGSLSLSAIRALQDKLTVGLLIYVVGFGIGYAIHLQKSPLVVLLMVVRSILLGAYFGLWIACFFN